MKLTQIPSGLQYSEGWVRMERWRTPVLRLLQNLGQGLSTPGTHSQDSLILRFSLLPSAVGCICSIFLLRAVILSHTCIPQAQELTGCHERQLWGKCRACCASPQGLLGFLQ